MGGGTVVDKRMDWEDLSGALLEIASLNSSSDSGVSGAELEVALDLEVVLAIFLFLLLFLCYAQRIASRTVVSYLS